MPIFTWTTLSTNILIGHVPVLTAVLALSLDRYVGTNSSERQRQPMMYVSLIWIWGIRSVHPDPARFRHLLEVIAFCGKRLFSYLDGATV